MMIIIIIKYITCTEINDTLKHVYKNQNQQVIHISQNCNSLSVPNKGHDF